MSCQLTSDGDEHPSTDLVLLTPQVQFNRGDNSALCRLSVINDTAYEGIEHFNLSLVSPIKVLIGGRNTVSISLSDVGDGKFVRFCVI